MPDPVISLLSEENLPEWNLNSLYSSLNDPKIQIAIAACNQNTKQFVETYKGLFVSSGWNSEQLLSAIHDFDAIQEDIGRLVSFSSLLYYKNLNDTEVGQFYQHIQEEVTALSGHLIFFTLELNQIEDDLLEIAFNKTPSLRRYRPWLEKVRLFRPHQLSGDLEKLFLEKSLTSSQAWSRLYEETLASMTFSMNGDDLNLSQVTDLTNHPDRQIRQHAALALSKGLNAHLPLFTFITNTLAKDKETEDTWRHYASPVHERHLINQIEPQVVEALVEAVKSQYGRLSHRYYALKAKLLKLEHLDYWDRNAPLSQVPEQAISWLKARDIVLSAYEQFSPLMAQIGRQFFDNNWIDVPVKKGKTSGAFSHGTIPSANPFILLNYQGKTRDVMTLAHELGHGIHQILASKQGLLLASTPLTLAETASVFGEMLTFQSLLKSQNDPAVRRQLLAGKIDDMLNTVVRQIAFYDFEQQVHTLRRSKELSAENIGNLWLETQRQALGPAVHVDDICRPYWTYISHFIHSPFYVYAYAFGDCLVNSLYAVYQNQPEGFAEKYIDLLSAGGTKKYADLLQSFGLKADDPEFWNHGLSMIADFINQLELLVD
ncbi:M3 family oligoendopeptidase [Candidatus Finniella inopinata]|uniref:M3 family oligoendopeptidase n=1 Tax=Candidatus Finniella inopinata TaxID=1696036 RepID=A0A4Q7DF64_9PROT|nr:M3 family oligoendopeptidase [Candidatus Finniella inopinata]RZI45333.1 M3 family oligoendopeptidase [Candidatus Finniella inopinata]